jgi:putative transposase
MVEQVRFSRLHHCVYALTYHLVLATKYRRPCITAAMLERFREVASARCEGWRGRLLELNGEPDHVHLLVELPPDASLSGFVNNLKTTSSRLLRRDFAEHLGEVYREPVFWSRSYCIITCGGVPLSILEQYTEQQERPD